jgi:dTDP-glucose 4,6-dehydratase
MQVLAYVRTYGVDACITRGANTYGPRQYPEKMLPLFITNAFDGERLPVYGDGRNVRDWLYVGDHCAAIRTVLAHGRPGETYNVGGNAEMTNIDVVRTLCRMVAARRPGLDCERLIVYVTDRPGHDRRYAIDASKIRRELGWSPAETFESGMGRTVDWYLANGEWLASVQNAEYREWVDVHYAQ